MKNPTRFALLAAAAFVLGACTAVTDIQEAISGGGETTDSRATKGPTLSIPPQFNLRPPVPGGGRSGEVASEVAKARVFKIVPGQPGGSATSAGTSPGEAAFLRLAGISAANPNIRKIVDAETTRLQTSEEKLVDKLLTWQNKPPPDDGTAKDGAVTEEAADGGSPVAIRSSKGLLGGVF